MFVSFVKNFQVKEQDQDAEIWVQLHLNKFW